VSPLAVASDLPSGAKAPSRMAPRWPFSRSNSFPVSTSQMMTSRPWL
jgi:hypothetical protein